MAEFKAYAQRVQVNGETVLSVVDGLGVFKEQALTILKENGISDPQPGMWYSQQAWLDSFKYIAQSMGGSSLYTIGEKIPANAKFPPDIDSLGKALMAIDVAYHMNHRGGEIGHYTMKRTGDRSVIMVCDNPYPCDFDRGLISAFTRRFKPKGFSHFSTVSHDDSKPCRKKGANSCTYTIIW